MNLQAISLSPGTYSFQGTLCDIEVQDSMVWLLMDNTQPFTTVVHLDHTWNPQPPDAQPYCLVLDDAPSVHRSSALIAYTTVIPS